VNTIKRLTLPPRRSLAHRREHPGFGQRNLFRIYVNLPRVYIDTTFVAWNVSGFPILSHVEGR
jgi:hypothetical protein